MKVRPLLDHLRKFGKHFESIPWAHRANENSLSVNHSTVSAKREGYPVAIWTGALLIIIFVVGIHAWNYWYLHARSEKLQKTHFTLATNIERILFLDEVRSMSARMAAATSDLAYQKRYHRYEPKLRTLIGETARLLAPTKAGVYVGVTGSAHRQLVASEQHAFDLIRAGRSKEALAHLSSREYQNQKDLYALGMRTAFETLQADQKEAMARERTHRLFMFWVGLCGAVIIFLAWVLSIRAARSWGLAHERDARELVRMSSEMEAVFGAFPDVYFRLGSDGHILSYHASAASEWHGPPEVIAGKNVQEILPAHVGKQYREAMRAVHIKKQMVAIEYSLAQTGRQQQHFEARFLPLLEDEMVVIVREITARKEMEIDRQKLHLAVEQSPSIVMITDTEGVIEYVNPKFTEVTGYSAEEVVGKTPRILKSGETPPERYTELWDTVKSGGEWHGEFRNRKKSGELYWELASISSIKDAQGDITHFLAVKEDITKRKWAEETIIHMAYYDPLTDLPNRVLFHDRLAQALSRARRRRQLVGILIIGLDRFKVINDTLGHAVGDRLLQKMAERLGKSIKEGDTLARLGGDEFMLLLPELLTIDEASKTAQHVLGVLQSPFPLEGHELDLTVSIGLSVFPYDGDDAETLLRNAATALTRAKEQGRNNYQPYAPAMNAEALGRMILENSLRKALERREFVIHYQPLIDLTAGEIVGAEALLRWQHPDLGMISPQEFIPMAEDNGLIIPVGEWVLRTACSKNRSWQESGYKPISISVNLSAKQFQQAGLPELLGKVLNETGLDPHSLELEITESVAMRNVDYSIAMLRDLKQMGIRISIDDFGTGYSSLSYLRKFPIDTLKIDRSFIRDLTADPNDAAITVAVIAMAHSLKLRVVAEGVETQEQYDFLKEHHCDMVQGYLFSHPIPGDVFETVLKERRLYDRSGGSGRAA